MTSTAPVSDLKVPLSASSSEKDAGDAVSAIW